MTAIAPRDASRTWWRSPLVLVPAASLILAFTFAHLASEVMERETKSFDGAVRDWVFAHRPPWLVSVFRFATLVGDRRTLFVVATIVALTLLRAGARVRPLLIAALPFVLSGLATLARGWFHVLRPPHGLLASTSVFGFPSGHTTGSTSFALVLGYVLARERGWRRLGWTIALAVPLLVGVSRIYLDMHWASDVIGGWLIGALYGVAVCSLYELAFRRAQAKARLRTVLPRRSSSESQAQRRD